MTRSTIVALLLLALGFAILPAAASQPASAPSVRWLTAPVDVSMGHRAEVSVPAPYPAALDRDGLPDCASCQVPEAGAPSIGSAISSGIASWYDAKGDVASVPWWNPGQDPVWASVSAFRDGRTYSVTVLVVGFCQCLRGTPKERAMDLSRSAFAQLAPLSQGLVQVQIEVPTQGPVLPATDGEKP